MRSSFESIPHNFLEHSQVIFSGGREELCSFPEKFLSFISINFFSSFINIQENAIFVHNIYGFCNGVKNTTISIFRKYQFLLCLFLLTYIPANAYLSLIHISEPTRRTPISY